MMTQTYAEFNLRIQLVVTMIRETETSWQRWMRTKDSWMANCVMG